MFISSYTTAFVIKVFTQTLCCLRTPMFLTLTAPISALLIANPAFASEQPKPLKSFSIQEVLQETELNNRTIQNSKRLIGVAQAEVKRADVGLNPTLSFGAFNSVAKRYRYSELDQTLRIEQIYERGDKRALRVAAAQGLVNATEADILEIIRQQKILTASTYVDLMLAQRVLTLSEENELNFKRLVDGAQKRLKAGDIASADVSRLSVELSRASNEVRAAQSNLLQAQFKLASQIAAEGTVIVASEKLPDANIIELNTKLFSLSSNAIAIENALQKRSDLNAARTRAKAFEKNVSLAKSQQIRDITVGAQTERAPGFGGRVFGLSASIPLLIGNDYSSEALKAAADLNIVEGEVLRIKAQIQLEIEIAFAQLVGAKDRLERLFGTTLPEVSKASQAIEYAYSRGAATLTDLFDSRRQFNAVQVETASAQADLARALYLYKATIIGTSE
jgi:outer membrane protein, heavy metal efflux system